MAIAYVLDSVDGLSDELKAEYTEKDGKFFLNLDGTGEHFVPRADYKKVNDESAARRQALSGWKKLGYDSPEAALEAFEANKAAVAKAGEGNAILQQKQKEWDTERDSLTAELNAARSSERSAVVEERLTGALAKGGATAEGLELLPERFGNRIKFETVGGKRVVKIMMADGETPMAGTGADGFATLDDLVSEAKKKFASLFKGDGGGGGGKPPTEGSGGGRSGVTKKSEFKSEKERGQWVTKHGVAAYNALPD